jgi:L-iditol 2-dehydrogenase
VLNYLALLVYYLLDKLSFSEGALVKPLSVALHLVRKSQLNASQTVLIIEAGAVGLLCARIAKISRAALVTIVNIDADRLRFAKEQGLANATVQIPLNKQEGELASNYIARLAENVRTEHSEEANIAFKCIGIKLCLNICIRSVGVGAKIMLVGIGAPRQQLNLGLALVREIEILLI